MYFNDLMISNCHTDSTGGGIDLHMGAESEFQLENSVFESSTARGGGGVRARIQENAILTVSGTVFTGNDGSSSGGGLEISGDGMSVVSISDTLITENSAWKGGGLEISGKAGGEMSVLIEDSQITGNLAEIDGPTELGGGIWLDAEAWLLVTDSDFGEGDEDNSPNDLHAPSGSFSDLGDGVSFSCDIFDACTGLP